MGIAAYNRGTALNRRRFDKDGNKEVVIRINKLPRGEARLLSNTVVRLDSNGRQWWLMNRQSGGWESFGYRYDSLRELFSHWNAYVVGYGRDAHSFYYAVESI